MGPELMNNELHYKQCSMAIVLVIIVKFIITLSHVNIALIPPVALIDDIVQYTVSLALRAKG